MEKSIIAVLGCGAISEFAYFPALSVNEAWRAATWLVEPNAKRGVEVAERFGFSRDQLVSSQEQLPSDIQLAINATPSHLHLDTTLALIERGIDVLVEKPFAENATDATAMVDAAAGRCLLSVNQSRRAGPSNLLVRRLIQEGKIGSIRRITWDEGHKFDWPSQSGFNFRRPWKGRPRGALLDIGVHVLDLLCWWLDATPLVLSANMDGYGGPEANLSARLALGDSLIDLRLSFLAKLKNQFVIEGTRGAIRGSTADYNQIELQTGSGRWKAVNARGTTDKVVAATRLIENMMAASRGMEALTIDAASTLPALRVIDEIYAMAHDVLPKCYWDFVDAKLPIKALLATEQAA